MKLEDSRAAFQQANRIAGGRNNDILDKLKKLKKMIFEREFAKSIEI